jgi:excisionase family DNA binding protein
VAEIEKIGPIIPLMTLDEVAARLGVSKAWVRDHATRRNPRIPVVRFGERRALLRFRPEDVEAFINSNLNLQERSI